MADENPKESQDPVTQSTRPTTADENLKLTETQLISAEKLYLLDRKGKGKFRAIGPWDKVDPRYLEYLCDRLANNGHRPCSRNHDVGAWASEDEFYRNYERPKTAYEKFRDQREGHSGRSSAQSGYSLPGYALPQNRSPRQPLGSRSNMNSAASHNSQKTQSSHAQSDDSAMSRYTRPTVASRGGVDIAEKFRNKDYVYGSGKVPEEKLDDIVKRVSRSTHASRGNHTRRYTDYVIGDKVVDSDEMEQIKERLVKPTVASQGGAPLLDKNFVYKIPPVTKTNLKIPHIEEKRKRRMNTKVTAEELQSIVERLNKLTPAYKAKYSLCPHVWVDDSKTGPAFKNQLTVA